MAKKTFDRTKNYVLKEPQIFPLVELIMHDAFDREKSDPKRLEKIERQIEADFEEFEAQAQARTNAIGRIIKYLTMAQMLFAVISKNVSPEAAANIFQDVSRRTRSKTYDPEVEKALCYHARVTGSTYETAKFAHNTCHIGQSVPSVQKHIQRLMAKADDKKSGGKCRDK